LDPQSIVKQLQLDYEIPDKVNYPYRLEHIVCVLPWGMKVCVFIFCIYCIIIFGNQ